MARRALARVWPGFWPDSQPFAFTQPASARITLVWPRRAWPAGYARVSSPGIPSALRGRLFVRDGFDPMLRATGGFSPAFEVGDAVLPALPPRHFGTDRFEGYAFLVHEFFHTYQHAQLHQLGVRRDSSRGIGTGPGAYSVAPAHVAGDEFLRGVSAERRVLIAALQPVGRDSLLALIRAYVLMREQRTASLPDVRLVEDGYEGSEGSATFVGYEAALAVVRRPRAELGAVISRRWLEVPIDSLPEGPERDARLMRWRLYGTGAAIAVILERRGVDWKGRLSRGESSLFDMLRESSLRP